MIYYKYDYNYTYIGSVDSNVTITSATTVAPASDQHIKYNPDTNSWDVIIIIKNLESYINDYLVDAKNYFNDLMDNTAIYTANFELSTYATQENEWRAWTADKTSHTPYADVLAAMRGITKEELMYKIGLKIQFFASIQGQLHAYQDIISSATTLAELEVLPLPWRA